MKNTIVIIVLLMSTSWANAQVGVNTTTPAATLDVVGKPAITSALDGFIPPRLTGAQLRTKTYTTAQTGAVVYVTTADTAPAGQTIKVTSTGLFSFDGSVWQVVSTPPANLPNGTGSVITINGQQQIAQEITLRLSDNWTIPNNSGSPVTTTNRQAIGQLTTELIDNYNSFTGTAGTAGTGGAAATGGTNSFTVNGNGTYLVSMNFPLQVSAITQPTPVPTPPIAGLSGNFYYGVFNVTDGKWETYSLDTISNLGVGEVKNIAYQVAVDMLASKTYSLYVGQQNSTVATITLVMRGTANVSPTSSPAINSPITFFSIKRLK